VRNHFSTLRGHALIFFENVPRNCFKCGFTATGGNSAELDESVKENFPWTRYTCFRLHQSDVRVMCLAVVMLSVEGNRQPTHDAAFALTCMRFHFFRLRIFASSYFQSVDLRPNPHPKLAKKRRKNPATIFTTRSFAGRIAATESSRLVRWTHDVRLHCLGEKLVGRGRAKKLMMTVRAKVLGRSCPFLGSTLLLCRDWHAVVALFKVTSKL